MDTFKNTLKTLPKSVCLRPVGPEDDAFLYRVYASTRQEELAPLNWSREALDAFLTMQFQAQHQHYMSAFPDAVFDIIVKDNRDIGRLYLDRRESEIRVVDIALLPAYRNQGIGSILLKEIIKEAQAEGKCVRLHVEKNNPALRLYHRLGFQEVKDEGVYTLLERPIEIGAKAEE